MLKELIKKLSQTTSINEKKKILETIKNNDKILLLLYYTYNPTYQYFIKKFDDDFGIGKKSIDDYIESLLILLSDLKDRKITGNRALLIVYDFISQFDVESQKIIKNVIKKDLKCGINIKLINSVFPNLIPVISYMGAIPFNKKKVKKLFKNSKEIFAQVKKDGMFVNIICRRNKIEILSRKGNLLFIEEIFKNDIEKCNLYDYVLNGELMIKGFDRYTANGLIRSYVSLKEKLIKSEYEDDKFKKKLRKDIQRFEEKYKLKFNDVKNRLYIVVWDIIPIISWEQGYYNVKYKERFELLKLKIENAEKIELIETKVIKNYNEALSYFKECLNKGEEGIILKSTSVIWKDGKSNEQIKFKIEMDVDLKIIGYKYGNKGTKYENFINRLICESEDGKLKTIPAGINEEIMKYLTEEKDNLINKIVTIKCSGISQDKESNFSLLHPRFECLRDDKNVADNLERIKEIETMCFELK